MTSLIGTFGPFDSTEESWSTYIERFELFMQCNDIPDAKKVSTFLTVIGVKTYNLLKDLITPAKPADKSFTEIVKIVENQLHPKPSFIAERYKFSKRDQQDHETVSEYIVQLKQLSKYCEFKDNLTDYLRDRLVGGLRDNSIKKRLLSEVDLTFEKAEQLATSLEIAEKDAATLAYHNTVKLQKFSARQVSHNKVTSAVSSASQTQQCYCCGKKGHLTAQCRYREYICNYCRKKGHLEKACKSKERGKSKFNSNSKHNNFSFSNNKSKQGNRYQSKQHFVDVVETNSNQGNVNDETYDISNIFQCSSENPLVNCKLGTIRKVEPIKVNLLVENKQMNIEVDSGACVSVISEKCYKDKLSHVTLMPTDLVLSSYTHEKIRPVGKIEVHVKYQSVEKCLDLYVITNGSNPLMGRDWIKELQITVSIPSGTDVNSINVNNVKQEPKVIQDLFDEFPEVFTNKVGCFKGDPVKLILKSNAIPKYNKPRPIPYALKDRVEKELQSLLEEEIISPVNSSEWATPIVPVLKRNGKIRICGDFKVTLNPFLEIDRHPVPRIEDLFASLQKGVQFSKIDLSQAYMQLKLDEGSKKLCTISTHKGLFAYNRLCYGIASAPGIFQRVIEQTLQGIPGTGIASFLDDIIVTGSNEQEHLSRLKEVCRRLKNHGLTVSKDKCQFFSDKLEYLGYVITKEGLATARDKVKAVVDAPVPKDVTQLKGFLGLVNYYAKFVPNIATILTPMYQLLRKDTRFTWSLACQKSFEAVKEQLVSAKVLAHYNPNLPIKLSCDASPYGIGSVLSIVEKDGVERPISFASRVLNSAERNYSQIDKEALSIVFGVKKFNQYVWGRQFTICTDHKPLLAIFGNKKGLPAFAAGRLQRYALFLSGYEYDVQYVKSQFHGNADGLSRLPLASDHSVNSDVNIDCVGSYLQCIMESDVPIDFKDIRTETQKDVMLNKIYGYVMHGWPSEAMSDLSLSPFVKRQAELTVECGILMWGYRVVVPKSLRRALLNELHSGHLGVVKMKSVARSYLWWPSIDKDIEFVTSSCSACLSQRENPGKSRLHVWEYPPNVWQRIHVDFLGPFKGKLYLIILDAHSKWLEVETVSSTSASQTIAKLRPIFCRFGLPELIVSDNGPPFCSEEFSKFLKQNGIRQSLIAPYHAATNGQAENAVKTVKKRLKCALFENEDVDLALSRFLIAYRNSVHSTTMETPAKLMFNRSLRTRLDLIRPNVQRTVAEQQSKQISNSRGSCTRKFVVGQPVLARDYRGRNKWVEAKIVQILGPVTYLVQIESGLNWKRHIDQLVTLPAGPVVDLNVDNHRVIDRSSAVVSALPSTTIPEHVTSSPCRTPPMQSVSPRHSPAVPSRHSLPPPALPPLAVTSPTTTNRRYPVRDRRPTDRLNL